jgi:hypothetical protein
LASLSSFFPSFLLEFLFHIVAGRHGGGREINKCYSETKKKQSWGMLPEDWRRVSNL